MTLMLPAEPGHARSLTALLPGLRDAVTRPAGHGWLPAARSAVIVLVDGLGKATLSSRAGHARFLTSAMSSKDVARSVFPTTTATALTSLMTGVDAGAHGIVGYRVRVPGTPHAANQLSGWERDGLDPESWQRARTLFEDADAPAFIVSREEYRGSGFTQASFRGATFLSAADVAERLLLAADTAARHDGAIVYAYAPELDVLGHRHGIESGEWTDGLETVDAAVRAFAAALPEDVGALVTADHGMIDVPRRGHVLLQHGNPLLDGVEVVAGEPRMLHLHAHPGDADRLLSAWRTAESARAWVMSRSEAIDAGLFGAVAADVAPRIGDVLVAARARVAYYDDRTRDKAGQSMVGQHGSLTSDERLVPLIRLGAFSRR